MAPDEKKEDTARSLASDLKRRISWEAELGSAGYDPGSKPATDSKPRPAPIPIRAKPSDGAEADRGEALAALRREIGDCTRCPLCSGRTNLVFGEGDPEAGLVFVGEGPGRDEDLAGRPFVGAAGQLLDKIIDAMGLSRDQVYICNVVKCRPPDNRTPTPQECATCGGFARRQLGIIGPKVAVALGGVSAKYLLGVDAAIGSLRGRFHDLGDIKLMPTFHPAYLLRNPSGKRPVWEDMQQVMKLMGLESA
jgi:DNA polymerase